MKNSIKYQLLNFKEFQRISKKNQQGALPCVPSTCVIFVHFSPTWKTTQILNFHAAIYLATLNPWDSQNWTQIPICIYVEICNHNM